MFSSGQKTFHAAHGEIKMADDSTRSLLEKTLLAALTQPRAPHLAPDADTSSPAAANPAIARCLQAYSAAYQAALATGKYETWQAENTGKVAYRNAMPPLIGSRNIRGFIACVGHAIVIQAMLERDSNRLLLAARIASTAHTAHSRKKNKSAALSAPKPPVNEHLVSQDPPVTQTE